MYTCGLSIVGADSLVTVKNIKKARHCLGFVVRRMLDYS